MEEGNGRGSIKKLDFSNYKSPRNTQLLMFQIVPVYKAIVLREDF